MYQVNKLYMWIPYIDSMFFVALAIWKHFVSMFFACGSLHETVRYMSLFQLPCRYYTLPIEVFKMLPKIYVGERDVEVLQCGKKMWKETVVHDSSTSWWESSVFPLDFGLICQMCWHSDLLQLRHSKPNDYLFQTARFHQNCNSLQISIWPPTKKHSMCHSQITLHSFSWTPFNRYTDVPPSESGKRTASHWGIAWTIPFWNCYGTRSLDGVKLLVCWSCVVFFYVVYLDVT